MSGSNLRSLLEMGWVRIRARRQVRVLWSSGRCRVGRNWPNTLLFFLRNFFWGLAWFGSTHTKIKSSPSPMSDSKQPMWAIKDSCPCLLPASLDKRKPKAQRESGTVHLQCMPSLAVLRGPAQNWDSVDLSVASSYWPSTCQHADPLKVWISSKKSLWLFSKKNNFIINLNPSLVALPLNTLERILHLRTLHS